MKLSKKAVAFMFISVMLTTLFTGCGSKKEIGVTEAPQANKTAQAETQKKVEPVTIKLVSWQSENMNNQPFYNEFMKENPDITIEIVETPDKEHPDKLAVMLAAGEDIDVFYSKNAFDYSDLAGKNQCLALEELIAGEKFDLTGYGPLIEGMKLNGKIYGLPYRKTVWALYYNKDIFDKAGVPYPKDDMTWNEFRELAKTLTKGEGNDKIWGAFIQAGWDASLYMSALQKGKNIMDSDLTPFKDNLLLLDQLYKDKTASDWGTNKTTSAHYKAAFEKGNVAMVPIGEWLMKMLIDDKKEGKHTVNWDVAAMPHPEGVKANTSWGSPTPASINASSKKVDAAWKFLAAMTGERGALYLAQIGVMPGYINDNIVKAFSSFEGAPGNVKAFTDAAVMNEQVVAKNAKAVAKIIQEEAELFLIGKNNIDITMQTIEKRREAELAK